MPRLLSPGWLQIRSLGMRLVFCSMIDSYSLQQSEDYLNVSGRVSCQTIKMSPITFFYLYTDVGRHLRQCDGVRIINDGESSLYRGTTLDYWSVRVNFIQPQIGAICGWSTVICSASEGFTEVVSHVHFAQELTSLITSASVEKDTWKNSLCRTAVSARAQPVLNSHRPCGDAVL